MNPGGIVVLIAGVWLGCQVFAGNALERLNVVKGSTGSSTAPAVATAPAAAPGTMNA